MSVKKKYTHTEYHWTWKPLTINKGSFIMFDWQWNWRFQKNFRFNSGQPYLGIHIGPLFMRRFYTVV